MFRFGMDKRTLYIIIAIIVIFSLRRYLTDTNALLSLVLTLPAVLIAITFHEFAHAFAADKLGDDTPRRQGRLTLNPLAHLDPVGSLMLVFAGFGWGKPVEINPSNFKRTISMSKGEAIVAIAGPLMNLLTLIQTTIIINIGLGVFNLIPLPPLDGSKVLKHFLPYKVKDWFERYSQVFYIIFVVLWVTDLAGIIISPVISAVYTGIVSLIGHLFGM